MNYQDIINSGILAIQWDDFRTSKNKRIILEALKENPIILDEISNLFNKKMDQKIIKLLKSLEQDKKIGIYEHEEIYYVCRLDKIQQKKEKEKKI